MLQWFLVLLLTAIANCDASSSGEFSSGLKGSKIAIPCIPASAKDNEMADLATEYHWTNVKGADLLDNRFYKNEAGDLEISNLHVADSGIYKCKVVTPVSTGSETTSVNTFQHKVLVFELTGHTFIMRLSITMNDQSLESVKTALTRLLAKAACQNGDLCQPGSVKVDKCESKDERTKGCEFSINFKAIPESTGPQCDENCVRTMMIQKLEKAQKVLEQELGRLSNDPKNPFKPNLQSLKTNRQLTCQPGFRLIRPFQKHCYPCQPGHYSGPNSSKCFHCEIGFYQEEYGKHVCNACPSGKTTDDIGSKLKDDCLEVTRGFVDTIKKGFFSIFGK